MAANQPKDWRKLCEAAAKEENPHKLMELVSEINKGAGRTRPETRGSPSE
jgi:hypothetical protein